MTHPQNLPSSPLHNHADVQIVSIVAPLTSNVRFEKVLQMGYRRALFEGYELKTKSAARIRSESKSKRGGYPRTDKTSDIAICVAQIHQCNQRRNNRDGKGIVHAMDYSRRVGSYRAFQTIPSPILAPFFRLFVALRQLYFMTMTKSAIYLVSIPQRPQLRLP